jgi:hypothetical protein
MCGGMQSKADPARGSISTPPQPLHELFVPADAGLTNGSGLNMDHFLLGSDSGPPPSCFLFLAPSFLFYHPKWFMKKKLYTYINIYVYIYIYKYVFIYICI